MTLRTLCLLREWQWLREELSLSIRGEVGQEVEVAREIRVNPAAFPGTVGDTLAFPWGVELLGFILTSMRVKGSQRKTELKK